MIFSPLSLYLIFSVDVSSDLLLQGIGASFAKVLTRTSPSKTKVSECGVAVKVITASVKYKPGKRMLLIPNVPSSCIVSFGLLLIFFKV